MNGNVVFINGAICYDALMGELVGGGNIGRDITSDAPARAFLSASAITPGSGIVEVVVHQYTAGRLSRCLRGKVDSNSQLTTRKNADGKTDNVWVAQLTTATLG